MRGAAQRGGVRGTERGDSPERCQPLPRAAWVPGLGPAALPFAGGCQGLGLSSAWEPRPPFSLERTSGGTCVEAAGHTWGGRGSAWGSEQNQRPGGFVSEECFPLRIECLVVSRRSGSVISQFQSTASGSSALPHVLGGESVSCAHGRALGGLSLTSCRGCDCAARAPGEGTCLAFCFASIAVSSSSGHPAPG